MVAFEEPESALLELIASPNSSKLIKQGAEAKIYRSQIFPESTLTLADSSSTHASTSQSPAPPVLLKYRFPKTYRHPTLSTSLTAARTAGEARALLRCARMGVQVPAITCVDERAGILGLEWIEGRSVREWLGGGAEGEEEVRVEDGDHEEDDEEEELSEADQVQLMRLIGTQLARMHAADVVHGDLTTSNMMLRERAPQKPSDPTIQSDEKGDEKRPRVVSEDDELVMIDFGLASVSTLAEDKAVDLYVLERAFASTHPGSDNLFAIVLDSYASALRGTELSTAKGGKSTKGEKGPKRDAWDAVRVRLEEVRLRGRKRSMVG